ncbi:hypothetical protein B1812_06820 [Methylocystis bryophila]|uniref:Uncharacterized protein n=1 Tax=Methylocystis bryophila TaxID=655015 RepID=A0A1W6MTE3_9HYPH|nr:hypothetical protein B1812_06820 [Methylocystis bryophila]
MLQIYHTGFTCASFSLLEWNRSNTDSVIDSKVLKRDWGEKQISTFSHRAQSMSRKNAKQFLGQDML